MVCIRYFLSQTLQTLTKFINQHLKYQIITIICIMKYIVIWYISGIVDMYHFIYKLGQSLCSLTFTKTNAHYIMGQRE